jgi:predicted phosphodiesterase
VTYITGDTHIPCDISKLKTKRFPDSKNLSKNDFLIICGDFGGVWNNDNEELYWRKWLDCKNFTTLFVDGNHENFNLLNEFEIVDFCNGKARKISDSIYHLMRGQIYEIDGKRIFTFGGAASHDIEYRTKDKNWWEEELPSERELILAQKNLEAVDWKVDYIVTHCAPTSIQQMIAPSYDANRLTDFLETIKEKATYQAWYFGHYHTDGMVEERFVCLFNQINQI